MAIPTKYGAIPPTVIQKKQIDVLLFLSQIYVELDSSADFAADNG
jgi:hypothetical protein